jgi:hypothetical protein
LAHHRGPRVTLHDKRTMCTPCYAAVSALERGAELARCAAEFMDAINAWDKAVEDGADITEAADKRHDAWLGLRNAIGDFTRASERAKS